MARFETSVTIDRPVEEVWKFITDLSNMPKWSNILESKQTSPGPMGVGTMIQDTRKPDLFASPRHSTYSRIRAEPKDYFRVPIRADEGVKIRLKHGDHRGKDEIQ